MQNLKINQDGICPQAQFIESPNHDLREIDDINLIVIHNISLPPNNYGGEGVIDLFTNQLNTNDHPYYGEIAHLKVSSHFFIRRDGSLIQFVPCTKRAWHAGVSKWEGREKCNDFSIGIELEGSDFEAFEPKQYDTLKLLIESLKMTYPIQSVVGHSDIAPGRKTDPGPYFNWNEIDA
ncbi:MAG: 1,6-anhydro-N-acetylmuramyl-L-alanine amidase AmpD [Candidatus Methylopumilus sp.]|jgi:AmpD protein|nr:1,6-anhydro-N-acetylmuramyl-L-alanine amidase AmpD [Candidatus Methylopumilus sp.]